MLFAIAFPASAKVATGVFLIGLLAIAFLAWPYIQAFWNGTKNVASDTIGTVTDTAGAVLGGRTDADIAAEVTKKYQSIPDIEPGEIVEFMAAGKDTEEAYRELYVLFALTAIVIMLGVSLIPSGPVGPPVPIETPITETDSAKVEPPEETKPEPPRTDGVNDPALSPVQKKVTSELLAFLFEQMEGDALTYQLAANAIESGKATSLADVQKQVKTRIVSGKDAAFERHLAPLLESINGENWNPDVAKEGFGQVGAIQAAIASRLLEAMDVDPDQYRAEFEAALVPK